MFIKRKDYEALVQRLDKLERECIVNTYGERHTFKQFYLREFYKTVSGIVDRALTHERRKQEISSRLNIVEATRLARDKGVGMRRTSWTWTDAYLLPSNNDIGYTVVSSGKNYSPRWCPSEEDILAEDWQINVSAPKNIFRNHNPTD